MNFQMHTKQIRSDTPKTMTDESVVNADSRHVFVDTAEGLTTAVKGLKQEAVIGVDLEADSMFHFKEKVCLLQMATSDTVYIIDPLAVRDLTPLKAVFGNSRIKKVFHGADYDIRSLYRDFQISIENLFDTELACRFLGMTQTSLDKVIQKYFDQVLDKKYQKKDWSQRPIPNQMIDYAAKDALFLVPLAQILEKQLTRKNRLDWVIEACKLLSRVRPSPPPSTPLYMNFKGAGRLDPLSLSILEDLLLLRIHLARQYDKPLFKVIGNHALLILANKKPIDATQLENSRALSARQTTRFGSMVLKVIQEALNRSETNLPAYPKVKTRRLKPSVAKRISALKSWKEEKAGELHIDPAMILTKAQMLAIADGNPSHVKDLKTIDPIKQWQIKEFGKEIIEVLRRK